MDEPAPSGALGKRVRSAPCPDTAALGQISPGKLTVPPLHRGSRVQRFLTTKLPME